MKSPFCHQMDLELVLIFVRIFTARKQSLGQGNIFTPVCHSVHRGTCVVAGGCPWLTGIVCGWLGACMVAGGA